MQHKTYAVDCTKITIYEIQKRYLNFEGERENAIFRVTGARARQLALPGKD